MLGLLDGATSFGQNACLDLPVEQIHQSYGKNDSLALPDPLPKANS